MKNQLIICVSSVFLLMGCNYKIENGMIPQEYLTDAEQYVGVYQGEFGQKIEGRVTFSMEGLKPVLQFEGENGEGLLGSGCEAHIGELKSVEFKGSRNGIKVFNFKLNHNCRDVWGKNLKVVAHSSQKIRLYVDQSWTMMAQCLDREVPLGLHLMGEIEMASLHNGGGGGIAMPTPIPGLVNVRKCYNYYAGDFSRQN